MSDNLLGEEGRRSFDLQHLPVSGVSADAPVAGPRHRKRGEHHRLTRGASSSSPLAMFLQHPPRILEALAQDRGEGVQSSSRTQNIKNGLVHK